METTVILECDSATITSIVELNNGNIVTQVEGQPPHTEFSAADEPLVIYQKGMIGHDNIEERSHRNLLSPYRMETREATGSVPWSHLVWPTADVERWKFARTSACETCACVQCNNRFRNVHPNNIKCVAMHDANGRILYQWCVAFVDGGNRLTPVPPAIVRSLVERMRCKRGGLRSEAHASHAPHPLLDLIGHQLDPDHDRRAFHTIAAYRFMRYRQRVHAQVAREKNRVCVPIVPQLPDTRPGQCTVCLEDTDVSRLGCVHKRCAIEVCSECRVKTRGMCPLCDRSKLAQGVMFMCMMCATPSSLNDFGFPCIRCGRPEACRGCFHRFRQCISCECDMSGPSKRRKAD